MKIGDTVYWAAVGPSGIPGTDKEPGPIHAFGNSGRVVSFDDETVVLQCGFQYQVMFVNRYIVAATPEGAEALAMERYEAKGLHAS